MKGYRVPVVILLIILLTAGWVNVVFFAMNNKDSQYNDMISEAQDYYVRGLYQLSAAKYEEALILKETREARSKLIESWATHYSQDEDSYSNYLAALLSAVKQYPEDITFLHTVTDLYLETDKYEKAYDLLKDAVESGMKDESVLKKYVDVKYSFEIQTKNYIDFKSCLDSMFLVSNGTSWGIIDEHGYGVKDYKYSYLSQPNIEGMMFYVNESGAKLIDKAGIVQGIFGTSIESAGFCAEDLIAIRENGAYAYYSIRGDKLFGDYKDAGTFSKGLAAVNIGGKWAVVDTKGQIVIEPTYEDIKLDQQGMYISKAVILAKLDGKYNLYDAKWNMIKDFSCDQADILTKDAVFAFSSGGKWGFVDTKGKVIIDPVYEKAKSFSNGLAAVCKDGLWGFIDKEGTIVIACQFLDADYFNEKGGCMVRTSTEAWQLLLRNITEN